MWSLKNRTDYGIKRASQVVLVVKNLPANKARDARDKDLIPGLGRYPGG